MSSYRKTVEKLAEQLGDRQPCRTCRTSTLLATLAQHGALCLPCFEAYCREPQPIQRRRDAPQQAEMRKRLRSKVLDTARAGHPVTTRAVTKALIASGDITKPTPSEFAIAAWTTDRAMP